MTLGNENVTNNWDSLIILTQWLSCINVINSGRLPCSLGMCPVTVMHNITSSGTLLCITGLALVISMTLGPMSVIHTYE